MADFIPAALAKFLDWVNLQLRKRPTYATALGLTAADVTARNAADTAMAKAVTDAADAQATAAAKVMARDEAIRTYSLKVRADIARAKTTPGYTETIGKECEWLSTSTDPTGRATLQPTLNASPSALGIVLKWSKKDQDGVLVYRRAVATETWDKLAFDSRSPYIDTETGLTGVYEYYVQLMKDDLPVGTASDIVPVVHGGR